MKTIDLASIRHNQEEKRIEREFPKHQCRNIVSVVECQRLRRYMPIEKCHKCIYLEYFGMRINKFVAVCNFNNEKIKL